MRAVYQELYDTTNYSRGVNLCQEIVWLYSYLFWLVPPVVVLGCGAGDGVRRLRELGLEVEGLDWVRTADDLRVGDITSPLDLSGFRTAMCVDVLEHIPERLIPAVLENMAQTDRQVITVWSGPAGDRPPFPNLHVTQHPLSWWDQAVREWFEIDTISGDETTRRLYLTQRRKRAWRE